MTPDAKLREAAEKATIGPYVHYSGSRGVYAIRDGARSDVAVATMAKGNRYGEKLSALDNGEFFALCDPQTILSLLDRLAEAEANQRTPGTVEVCERCYECSSTTDCPLRAESAERERDEMKGRG